MKKSQVLELLKYINTYYGKRFEIPNNKAELAMKIETWYDFLQDYDYKETQVVTQRLISVREWAPTPGEIIDELNRIKTPEQDQLTPGEAWELVLRAIRIHGVLYNTKAAEASLPKKVLKAANCVGGLRNIGMSNENDTYFMNQFCKVYEDVSRAIDMDQRLPESIKRKSEMLAQKYKNPQLSAGKERKEEDHDR